MARRTSHPPTTFANAFGIIRGKTDDWFDPKLHTDTDLFVDPFLMFDVNRPPWSSAQDRLVEFFNRALQHAAASNGIRSSADGIRAAAMLSFPEAPQVCLGYSQESIFGKGSARGLGLDMLGAADRAISAGIVNINEFGELMLFGDGFGADRVSDMTCNIVMDMFVRYTQKVAARHQLPVQTFTLPHMGYDYKHDRWRKAKVDLPLNPCWTPATPVILVPQAFLDELPKMDDGVFWDWVFSSRNDQLRTDLGLLVTDKIKRNDLIRRAKQSPNLVRRYGIEYAQRYRAAPPSPYDFDDDPQLKTRPTELGQEFAAQTRAVVPASPAEFCTFVDQLVADFKWMVEERGLAKHFWRGDRPLAERETQYLFDTAVLLLCKRHDIDFTPEAGTGRGPVDFKFSAGWKRRSVVELKFAKSTSYWDNIANQPPAYMMAADIACGTIVVVQHEAQHCEPDFIARTEAVVQQAAVNSKAGYRVVFIDVHQKPSASKTKSP